MLPDELLVARIFKKSSLPFFEPKNSSHLSKTLGSAPEPPLESILFQHDTLMEIYVVYITIYFLFIVNLQYISVNTAIWYMYLLQYNIYKYIYHIVVLTEIYCRFTINRLSYHRTRWHLLDYMFSVRICKSFIYIYLRLRFWRRWLWRFQSCGVWCLVVCWKCIGFGEVLTATTNNYGGKCLWTVAACQRPHISLHRIFQAQQWEWASLSEPVCVYVKASVHRVRNLLPVCPMITIQNTVSFVGNVCNVI